MMLQDSYKKIKESDTDAQVKDGHAESRNYVRLYSKNLYVWQAPSADQIYTATRNDIEQ